MTCLAQVAVVAVFIAARRINRRITEHFWDDYLFGSYCVSTMHRVTEVHRHVIMPGETDQQASGREEPPVPQVGPQGGEQG
jgi:hypothetical protein